MIHHVVGLFTHPDQEWREIRGEEESISHMYLTHVLILAAIPAVSAYIGTTQVGWVIGNPSRHLAEPPDLRFYAQQQRTMLWTAGLALLLAALAALVSARSLLRPIRELADEAAAIRGFDFAADVATRSVVREVSFDMAAGEVLAEGLGDFPQHVVLAGFGELLPQGPGVARGQRLEDVADLAAAQPVQQVLDFGQVGAVHHGLDELLPGHALAMHHAFHEALFAQELGDLFEGHSLGGSQGRLEKKTGQAAPEGSALRRGGEAAGQAAHDLQREGWVVADDVLKAAGVDGDEFAVLPCFYGGRPWARRDEGEFTHDGAGAEGRDGPGWRAGLGAAVGEDVQGVTGVTLLEKRATGGGVMDLARCEVAHRGWVRLQETECPHPPEASTSM